MPELAEPAGTCRSLLELAEPAGTCQNLSELAKLAGTCGTCRNLSELCRHSRNVLVVIAFLTRFLAALRRVCFHTDLPCRPQPPAPPTARTFPCRNLPELVRTFMPDLLLSLPPQNRNQTLLLSKLSSLSELAEPAGTCRNLHNLLELAGTCGTCRNVVVTVGTFGL